MKKLFIIFVLLIGALSAVAAAAPTYPVLDTGISKCYNASAEIPCPKEGEDFYGQDGNYSINPMSYTKLDASGNELPITATTWAMVKDNFTGLIWENKNSKDNLKNYTNPNDADNTYTWYDSNAATNGGDAGTAGDDTDTEDFIKALNGKRYGGYSDWRLPTFYELKALVDYSSYPSINTNYLKNMYPKIYWSNTTCSADTKSLWSINFNNGITSLPLKSAVTYAMAVRGSQPAAGPTNNLVDNNDGTISDTATGLMWQQSSGETAAGSKTMNWKDALSYCYNLNLGGHTDWRLPTIKELATIVDYSLKTSPMINTTIFYDVFGNLFWSSSNVTYPNEVQFARTVNFSNGHDIYLTTSNFKTGSNYVRAVRGGQAGSSESLVMSVNPASRNVAKEAGTTTFAVSNTGTGTMNWSAAVASGTWLTITSGSSGSNTGTINCSYTANTTASARTASIRVTATGADGSPKDITVVQAAATSSSNPSLALIDSTGSPGSTVKVSLNFTNTTGVDVAAISTDIVFDSAVFEADSTNQTYAKNPSAVIGAAGTAAGKSVNYNLISNNTLRVGIVSTNTNKIGNGVAAEITFYIKSGVSNGTTELTQSNLSGSNPDGNEVAITGSKGKVTISNCILGDCDCNGSVSISEVQTAINMYLGKKTVTSCCDRDGNGAVSISEVQSVINNYLGINPKSKHSLRMKKMPAVVNIERTGDGYSLRLDSNRNNVAAISIDVAHSQELAGNISFELGASAELAGKELIQTQIQPEITRITIVSTFDNEPITDGEILFVNVDGYSDDDVVNFKITASDDDGNSVDIR